MPRIDLSAGGVVEGAREVIGIVAIVLGRVLHLALFNTSSTSLPFSSFAQTFAFQAGMWIECGIFKSRFKEGKGSCDLQRRPVRGSQCVLT